MKRTEFAAKDTKQKIEYLSTNNKSIFDLLKVDIADLSDENLVHLYDFTETFYTVSDQTEELPNKLDAVAKTATAKFEDALRDTDLLENVKTMSAETFKMMIVPAISSCADYMRQGYNKAGNHVIGKIASPGMLEILEKMMEFRKQIDKQFPGVADTVIAAAGKGLIAVIALYAPALSTTVNSLKLVESVQGFLKVDSLEKTIETLSNKLEEIKQDKILAVIHKTGEKIGELSVKTKIPVEDLQNLGSNLETVEKTISQVSANNNAKEFIKYLSTEAGKMPSTIKELSENLQKLSVSLHEAADNSGISANDSKKFKIILEKTMQEVEKTYSKGFEKDKNIFEKIVCAQNSMNMPNSALNEFKNELAKAPGGKAIAEKFSKEFKVLIKQSFPDLSSELIKQAKKAPTLAKDLGLNIKVEAEISKLMRHGSSR